MLIKLVAVVTNYTQKMVDRGFLEFDWVPERYELTPPEGQEFEEEPSPSPPPKVEKPRPKPMKVSATKKAGKSGGEDVEMAEVEEARPKRTIKRTEKARQLFDDEDDDDEYVITPPFVPRSSQGGDSTRSSGGRGASSSKRPMLTVSHVEVPAKRTRRATSDVASSIAEPEPVRSMRDLSSLTFEAGTRVDLSLFPGVVPPVSVPSFPSQGARAAHPFL